MKNFKRKLAGLLVFAMVLGIMAPGVVAQAEDKKPVLEVEIDYLSEKAKVTTDIPAVSLSAIYYADMGKTDVSSLQSSTAAPSDAIKKALAKGEKISFPVKDNGEEDSNAGYVVDLSWVKKNKDVNLIFQAKLKDGTSMYTGVQLKAQKTNVAVGLITVATSSSVKVGKTSVAVPDEDLSAGTKEDGYVVFLVDGKPVSSQSVYYSIGNNKVPTNGGHDAGELGERLYQLKLKGAKINLAYIPNNTREYVKPASGGWISKVATLSYKKQANAPKVKVDVSKKTIALKAGLEYRLPTNPAVNANGGWCDWVKVDDMKLDKTALKELTIDQLWTDTVSKSAVTKDILKDIYEGKPVEIEIRTAANATKATAASKTQTLELKSQPATPSVLVTSAAIQDPVYDTEKESLILENKDSSKNYEYCFIVSGNAVTAKTKWSALKSGKTVAVKKAKIQDVDKKEANMILFRIPGDKKTGILASSPVAIDLVPILKEVTVASGATVKTPATGYTAGVDEKGQIVTVTGSSVSGSALDLSVEITMKNLSKGVKVTTPKDAKIGSTKEKTNVTAALSGDKLTVTIKADDPKGAAVSGNVEISIGKKTKVTLKVDLKKYEPTN